METDTAHDGDRVTVFSMHNNFYNDIALVIKHPSNKTYFGVKLLRLNHNNIITVGMAESDNDEKS